MTEYWGTYSTGTYTIYTVLRREITETLVPENSKEVKE